MKGPFSKGAVCALCLFPVALLGQAKPDRSRPTPARAASFAHLPLTFEANQGQTDPRVNFLSRGQGYILFLSGDQAVLELGKPSHSHLRPEKTGIAPHTASLDKPSRRDETPVLRIKLLGSQQSPGISGVNELPAKSNYFIGNNPGNWRTNVAQYGKVGFGSVYPGIDLLYYGNNGQLENDFVVAPGVDPGKIQLALEGFLNPGSKAAVRLRLDAKGDLNIGMKDSEVTLHKPVAYQLDPNGGKHFVESHYLLRPRRSALQPSTVAFAVGNYDRSRALVIDPTLAFATYIGGSNLDSGDSNDVAVDGSGNVYFAAMSLSTNYPTGDTLASQPYQSAYGGSAASLSGTPGAQTCDIGDLDECGDAVITKLDPNGNLLYSTYLGGNSGDGAFGLAVDADGDAYVAGQTTSSNFPVTPGAYQQYLGQPNPAQGNGPATPSMCGQEYCSDVFVTKLDPTGSQLLYSTFLGGAGADLLQGLAIDGSGDAFVTGNAGSPDFPNPNNTTLLGDLPQNACPAYGCNLAYVTELNPTGTGLVYSVFLGGSLIPLGVALDSSGDAFITGGEDSAASFPGTTNAFNPTGSCSSCNFHGFLTELDPAGATLLYSTVLGGTTGSEFLVGVTIDANGNPYIAGESNSSDFPVTPGAYQTKFPNTTCGSAPCAEAVIAKFDTTQSGANSLVYATFLGGSLNQAADQPAVDSSGDVYVSGETSSFDFPVVNPIQGSISGAGDCHMVEQDPTSTCGDAYVAELNPTGSALLFSTYLGGSNVDTSDYLVIDPAGNIYVSGLTYSSDFPVTSGAFQTAYGGNGDAFVAKITPASNTAPSSNPNNPAVTITPTANVTMTFSGVTSPGTTAVTQTANVPALPANYGVGQCSGSNQTNCAPVTFYDVTTSATYSGSIVLCFNAGSESNAQVLHYQNGAWVNVTTSATTNSNDQTIVCGTVTSLSPFAIVGAPVTVSGFGSPFAALVPAGTPIPVPANAFKLGSTLPLKLDLYLGGAELIGANDAPQIVGLVRSGTAVGLGTVDLDTGASDTGTAFRLTGNDWTFNLSTKSLTAGSYIITISAPGAPLMYGSFVLR